MCQAPDTASSSIREIEVVVGVVIVLALTEAGEHEVQSEGNERDTAPDANAEVDNPSLDEEALHASVEPVEKPLLGRIGTVMENITSCE